MVSVRVEQRCLETLDNVVGFQAGHEDVEEPESYEEHHGGRLVLHGPAEFPADSAAAPEHEHRAADEGAGTEEGDREGEVSRLHAERAVSVGVVEGSHGPREADAQEDVDGVAAGHVADRGVGVFVVLGCHFAGKGVCKEKKGNKWVSY